MSLPGRRSVAAFVVAAACVLTGCGSTGSAKSAPTTTAPASVTLEGPTWSLASTDAFTLPEGASITATFADGTVSGSAGCNRYSAGYTLDGDQLTIKKPGQTAMACSPNLDAAERGYVTALSRVESYSISDAGSLELSTRGGDVLTFEHQEQSVIGLWTVTGYLNKDATAHVSVIPGASVTARFGSDSTVSGSSGCNSYSGGYRQSGTAISIGPLAATQMACAKPAGLMEQEVAFLAAMESAKTFELKGNVLTLFDAEGRRAVDMKRVS